MLADNGSIYQKGGITYEKSGVDPNFPGNSVLRAYRADGRNPTSFTMSPSEYDLPWPDLVKTIQFEAIERAMQGNSMA